MIEQNLRQRVSELLVRGNALLQYDEALAVHLSEESYEAVGWVASALNAIANVFPDSTHTYRKSAAAAAGSGFKAYQIGALISLLRTMLDDIDAGLVTSIADATRGEVFGTLLEHAEFYVSGARVDVAGVVAGVAFEDTIRRACDKRDIDQVGVDLEQLIIALTKANAISAVKAQRARAAAGLRTKATHAQWDQFDKRDVQAAIDTTRDLVENLLS